MEEAVHLVALFLHQGYECKRIYLYGSVITDKALAPWSDIDLAIEGLDKEKFLKAYAFFLKNSRFPIDLKPFEELDSSIKERIKKEGKVIYGKG